MHKKSAELLWKKFCTLQLTSSDVLNYNQNTAKSSELIRERSARKMTDMKRVTISLPDSIDRKVLELRKDDRFVRCSYSEIVRRLLEAGLSAKEHEKGA